MRKLSFAIFALLGFSAFGQHGEQCAASHQHENYLLAHPDQKVHFKKIEQQVQAIIAQERTTRSATTVYQIPVVVHVMHLGEAEGSGTNISDAQIQSGIDQLNEAFRNTHSQSTDTYIEFVLAKQDENCNATTGIVRVDASGVAGYASDGINLGTAGADEATVKALSKWSNTDYYNIWIVSEMDGNDGGFGTQGFAYYPGTSATYDGAMVMHTAWGDQGTVNSWNNQGKTIIHELGHALNLYHTFQGDDSGNQCPSDADCGTNGDCCADTEVHKRSNSICPTGNNECTGVDYGDVIHNYMDYSSQNCQYMFTPDQISRMRAALEGPRKGLTLSKGLIEPTGSFASPIAASCEPTTSATGLSGGYAGIMQVDFHTLSNATSYSKNDGGYLDFTGDCLKEISVNPDSTYELSVEIWANDCNVKAWIDYNNDGSFNNTNELIYNETVPAYNTNPQNVTIPNNATEDVNLRMRVMVEAGGSVSSACYDPTYGQAEDYNIKISAPAAVEADFTASKTTACIGDTVQLTDASTGSPNSWSWDFDGAAGVTTTQNTEVIFSANGSYDIILTASDGSSSDKDTLTITVNTPTFSLGDDVVRCAGQGLIDITAQGGFASYSWVDGFSSSQTFSMMVPGNVWCEVTNADGCSASDTIVFSESTLDVTADGGFDTSYGDGDAAVALTFGNPSGGTYSGTGVSGGNFDPAAAGIGDHDIKYVYEDSDGCQDSVTLQLNVSAITGLYKIDGLQNAVVAPNPTSGHFTISFDYAGGQQLNYLLTDISGRIVNQGNFIGSSIVHNFDLTSVEVGIYYLSISDGNETVSLQIVKR